MVGRRGVYDTATKDSILSDHAEYCRLRRESECDPFLGIQKVDDDYSVLNSTFVDCAHEFEGSSCLECFQDLSKFTTYEFSNPDLSLECVLNLAASEVDWQIWNKFLDDDSTGLPYLNQSLGSGGFSPLSNSSKCSESCVANVLMEGSTEVKQEVSSGPSAHSYFPLLKKVKQEALEECTEGEKLVLNSPRYIKTEPVKTEFEALILPKPRPMIMRPAPKIKFTPRPVKSCTLSTGRREQRSFEPPLDRRRELNRDAALRYREKKKAEALALRKEFVSLDSRNKWLRSRTLHLTEEVGRMRSQLKDLGAFF